MKTFAVRAQRSGRWWALDVPELSGVFSQVRRLDQAEAMARDAIAAMLDLDPASFDVEIAPSFAPDVKALLDSVCRARQALDEAQRTAAAAVQHAATVLTHEDGFSMRDAGRALGISHQRVAQILEESERLGRELGNLGGGDFGGVALPEGGPMGPYGVHHGPIGAKAG